MLQYDKTTNKLTINIGTSCSENMQTDKACFESYAILAWLHDEDIKVQLNFTSLKDSHNKLFKLMKKIKKDPKALETFNDKDCHYFRFLYRAWKFKTYYNNFTTNHDTDIINIFGELYEKILPDYLVTNFPNDEFTFPKDGKISEHLIETWFVAESRKPKEDKHPFFTQRKSAIIDYPLNRQLPCDLFIREKYTKINKGKNKLFSSGQFDLWGIDDNNTFNLFELKLATNNSIGIISELFFYANLSIDMLKILKLKKIGKNYKYYRGYGNLIDNIDSISKNINAYFLAPEINIDRINVDFSKIGIEIKTDIKIKNKIPAILNKPKKTSHIKYQWLPYVPEEIFYEGFKKEVYNNCIYYRVKFNK